ncbi:MAG: NfeD family protein [Cellulosilyticaceae bacterium]
MLAQVLDGMSLISIILLIAGFILIGIEFTAPGISVPGISGIICLVVSVFLTADSVVEGAIMTIVILAILGVMLGITLWLLAKGKLIKPLILTEEQKKEHGYISSSDLDYLLGKKGTALTDLRPTGVGNFEGINFDVISEGQYISKGTEIEIYRVKGSRLIVKSK